MDKLVTPRKSSGYRKIHVKQHLCHCSGASEEEEALAVNDPVGTLIEKQCVFVGVRHRNLQLAEGTWIF